jgi:glyoxylase-like metal-dependent hydrolase (beta-lactamase superfamily II)
MFNAPLMVHEAEAERLTRVSPGGWITGHWQLSPRADRLLKDGDTIDVGSLKFTVIHTPGHSPGGICLRFKKAIFTGDTLFAGSIGRTDLKGGDYDTLVASIRERLFILFDDVYLYPGHGEKTNIENERKYNIFVRLRPEQIEQLLFGSIRKKKPKKLTSPEGEADTAK